MKRYRFDVMNTLVQRITSVIDPSPASTAEVLETLRHLTACYMSVLCPGCRESYAEYMHQMIPQTLAEANDMAEVSTEYAPQHDHLH